MRGADRAAAGVGEPTKDALRSELGALSQLDTLHTAAERAQPTALSVARRVLAHEWTPRLVVIFGAALTFALLAMEYFKA